MPASRSSPDYVPSRPNMGDQVHLLTKGNEGKQVWQDAAKGDTAKMTHILIEDHVGVQLRSKRVMKTSVAPLHSAPTTRFQAMIQQKTDIKTAINSIVKKMAKCRVASDDKLKNYIGGKVDAEIAGLVEKGNMDWTEIHFGLSDADEERMRAAEAAAAEAERAAALAREAAAREACATRAAEDRATQEARC